MHMFVFEVNTTDLFNSESCCVLPITRAGKFKWDDKYQY